MEKIYIAYQRKVNNEIFYFVKGFYSFPNLPNATNILENYGMHSNFFKACQLAQINDERVIQSLHKQFEIEEPAGKIVPLASNSHNNSFIENTRRAIFKLKLASFF